MAITIRKIACPDGDVSNSDDSYTASVASGGSLELPDSQINVNGSNEGNVVSVKTIDVNITDGTSPIVPDAVSLSGNTLDIEITNTPAIDPDASAFLTATGISDATIENSINNLVVGLKNNNLWSKMKAIYPMVGGTATTHKFNLKDAQDLDAAFRLTFSGGWTHSATGAAPNGTNAYADTHLNISTEFTDYLSSHHLSFYSRTQVPTGNGWCIGVGNSATGDPLFGLSLRRSSGNVDQYNYDFGNFSNNGRLTETPTVTGLVEADNFFIGSSLSTTSRQFIKSSKVRLSSTLTVSGTPSNSNIWLGALNPFPAGTILYMSNECAFSSIGDGLTYAETQILYGLVQSFNAALNRAV